MEKDIIDMDTNIIFKQVANFLISQEFTFKKDLLRGVLFEQNKQAVIIDFCICNNENPFQYVEYTKEQNLLMFKYDSIYRFVVDNQNDFEEFKTLFFRIQKKEWSEENIKTSGKNRELKEIDPSIPEAYFEQAFIEVYGNEALESVCREQPFIDMNSQTRYIDYLVSTQISKIAVEKNGESFHHPIIIGKQRYKNQLLKQNSLVLNNIKVYRWSIQGMQSTNNFHEELKAFIGKKEELISSQKLSISRPIKLFSHQQITLDQINQERENGENSFLIVLPTGTGKTEIFVSDLINQIKNLVVKKALILVPQIPLRDDTIKKVKKRLLSHHIHLSVGASMDDDIVIVTYAYISRNYYHYSKEIFDYLIIDEAHHAVAPMLSKVIQYFVPKTLIGVTATDKRLDEKSLEEVFGKYDESLSLKEAIKQNLLVPIKAFRLQSSIDLSEIRFNGKDYLGTDLQRNVIVPSRDQLIVDVLKKYFFTELNDFKSGLIFCVSIKHAQQVAKRMKDAGFTCEAVSGEDKKSEEYIANYQQKKIQFLTTCSLLNEGWDSPITSIIVMARPTLSKVLYTQQIGRGTRKMKDKEALYVIDVVDNYGAYGVISNRPWSIHALLGIGQYKPFANILNPTKKVSREELLLEGLYESERKLEPIDIFTFEEKYGDYLSDEKLARELFVSTSTINNWVKKKKIIPSITLSIGKQQLNYYSPEYKEEIIQNLNLKRHDETTIYQDFFDFIDEGNYSLSYKMIMLFSFFKVMNINGECNLEELVKEYSYFYKYRLQQDKIPDRSTCPFTLEFVINDKKMTQNLLKNPFEKFERKRFLHHAKDLKYVMISSLLWQKLRKEDIDKIKIQLFDDLKNYYNNLDAPIDDEYWKKYWIVK